MARECKNGSANVRIRSVESGIRCSQVLIRRKGHSLVKTFNRREDAQERKPAMDARVDRNDVGTFTEAQRWSVIEAIERYVEEVNAEHKDASTRAQ
jgi:hypothetical protein